MLLLPDISHQSLTMRSSNILPCLALLIGPTVASFDSYATYSTFYDNASQSTSALACSSWANTAGYATLGELPNFAFIGGKENVTEEDCGTCYILEYQSRQQYLLVIDTASFGFNTSYIFLDALTSGSAKFLISVPVTATPVDPSNCGL